MTAYPYNKKESELTDDEIELLNHIALTIGRLTRIARKIVYRNIELRRKMGLGKLKIQPLR